MTLKGIAEGVGQLVVVGILFVVGFIGTYGLTTVGLGFAYAHGFPGALTVGFEAMLGVSTVGGAVLAGWFLS